jgi:hypothetical protein
MLGMKKLYKKEKKRGPRSGLSLKKEFNYLWRPFEGAAGRSITLRNPI